MFLETYYVKENTQYTSIVSPPPPNKQTNTFVYTTQGLLEGYLLSER